MTNAAQHPDSPDTGCSAFRSAFHAVVDGEADALSVARTMSHVSQCPDCARQLDAARRYRERMLRVGDAEKASPELRDRVLQQMLGVRGSRSR